MCSDRLDLKVNACCVSSVEGIESVVVKGRKKDFRVNKVLRKTAYETFLKYV